MVPYVDGRLKVETAKWAFANQGRPVPLSDRDDSYYEALVGWWEQPGDLVIVEQDVVPAEGVVDEMLSCEFEWCSSPIWIDQGHLLYGWGLGCVKFSQDLRFRHSDLAVKAGQPGPFDPEPPRAWWTLDVRLGALLARRGYLPHGHAESVHLHPQTAKGA